MREHWLLPNEAQFAYGGPDWFLLLSDSDNCSPEQRDLVKLVLWRAWATHNNITHQSGPMGIYDGVQALLSMRNTVEQIKEGHIADSRKGKEGGPSNRKGRRLQKVVPGQQGGIYPHRIGAK